MKFRKTAFLLLFLMGFTLSLSAQDLDREKAATMITKHSNYPYVDYITLRTDFYCLKESNWLKSAIQSGVMKKTKSFFNSNQNCWNYQYSVTPRYSNYHLYSGSSSMKNTRKQSDYVSGVVTFKRVTGIKFNGDKTSATIEYQVERTKATPFARAAGRSNGLMTFTTTMELYDDGWRVTGNRDGYYKYDRIKYSWL